MTRRKSELARMGRVKQLPCIACAMCERIQNTRTEVHHINLAGKHGQRRLGDRHTIPLCEWHHRGVVPAGFTRKGMSLAYGPSFFWNPRCFKERHSFDELLAETDKRL